MLNLGKSYVFAPEKRRIMLNLKKQHFTLFFGIGVENTIQHHYIKKKYPIKKFKTLKMDKHSFSLLPISDKLNIIKSEAELLTNIFSLNNTIALYAYNGFLIEEHRDTDNDKLIKIEPILPDTEAERLKIYSMYIDYVDNSLQIKKTQERAMLACLNCDYEWFSDGRTKTVDIKCPVCETNKWTFLFKRTCNYCNSTYYNNSSSHKRPCPKCK